MPKTDKELAVDIVCAYLRAHYSVPDVYETPDRDSLRGVLRDAYDAVHALPDDPEN